MFKFKLGRKQHEETESRRRIQKDLFHFEKISDRGFPTRPSALAYDSQLNLIAIGTHTGDIRIYGQPGFQLAYTLESTSIYKIVFLTGLARLLVLTHDGYLHLFEINNNNPISIDRICASNENEKEILKNIQTICLLRNNLHLLVGLNNGNIYLFNLEHFSLNIKSIIPTETIEKTIGEHCNGRIVHPGSVQSIVQHPINDDKILIGYKNTVIVHWDLPSNSHDRTYIYKQEVESACWYNQGLNFATCHNNGSYALWDTKHQSNIVETEKIPYGPYPCTAMTKICVKIMRNDDPLIIFSGGLPRSTYANKHSVSCICENEHNSERTRHVTFDFTSNIIDFFTIDKQSNRDDPQTLVILLNEELIVIDLVTDSWPLYHLPYLNSLHTSPVICTTFLSNINREFYKKILNYASIQFEDYSDRKWPITGGEINQIENESEEKHVLLTGHEDGSVQFWDVTHVSMPLIYKLKTNDYFHIEQASNDDIDEETWPPFRKTGQYDPYCDDPRLAIQKLSLCTNTETLTIAGTAGQVLTFQLTNEPLDVNLTTLTVNLLDGCESFVWKGHEEMKIKSNFVNSGFYAISSVQLYPPAAVSALALCSDIQSYAVGTAHGFSIIHYGQNRILLSKCTLDPNALGTFASVPTSTGEATLIRGRSLKKSLRESFRRFRKGRTIKKTMMPKLDETLQLEDIARVPVERQVESREFKPIDDQINSMVRCLYFAKTYLSSLNDRTRSIWIGTNGGHVYVYSINGLESQTVQGSAIATDYSNPCALSKEIRLKHKAPVLSIIVLDNANRSIGQGSNIPTIDTVSSHSEPINNTENPISHKVLICSEEQFKIFTLPHLKPFCKHKLTATEGTRVRKIALNQFTSESHSESCLICLDNMGQISIFSLPTLRRQRIFSCIKPTDISALSSFQFTPYAHAFYLQSSSELAEISLTTQKILSNSMMISYDKLQRKTIVSQTPSKNSSISSPPEEPLSTVTVKSDTNVNNSASDSAIDVQSINHQIPIDEEVKSIEQNVTNNSDEQQESISPKSHKKPPPPPPPPPKPPKLVSVKLRQAPTINELGCFNGTNTSSPIHT